MANNGSTTQAIRDAVDAMLANIDGVKVSMRIHPDDIGYIPGNVLEHIRLGLVIDSHILPGTVYIRMERSIELNTSVKLYDRS
jgi:hypothetical protein